MDAELSGGQAESLFDEALAIEVRELPEDLAPVETAREQAARGHGRPTVPIGRFVRLMVVKQRTGFDGFDVPGGDLPQRLLGDGDLVGGGVGAARTGRNPQTGEDITIKASKAPKFAPGAALKAAVNGSRT